MIFDLFTEKVVSFDPLLTTFSDGSRLSDYLVDLSCFQDVSKRTTVLDSFVSLGFFVVELDDSLKQVLANNHYLKTKQFKEGITYNAILFVLPKKIMDVRQKFKEVITISGKPLAKQRVKQMFESSFMDFLYSSLGDIHVKGIRVNHGFFRRWEFLPPFVIVNNNKKNIAS